MCTENTNTAGVETEVILKRQTFLLNNQCKRENKVVLLVVLKVLFGDDLSLN